MCQKELLLMKKMPWYRIVWFRKLKLEYVRPSNLW